MASFKPKWTFCEVRIACDGDVLGDKRKDKGICSKCETKQTKRAKVPMLRGVNTALPNPKKPRDDE